MSGKDIAINTQDGSFGAYLAAESSSSRKFSGSTASSVPSPMVWRRADISHWPPICSGASSPTYNSPTKAKPIGSAPSI